MSKYWKNILALVIVIVVSTIGAVVINSYKYWYELITTDDSFDVDNNFPSSAAPEIKPVVNSGAIILYEDFIMRNTITPDSIRDASYKIRATGKIDSANLIVEASPTSYGRDVTRIHTVYFYIDDGKTGGHLASKRKDARIVEGGFRIGEKPYRLDLDLKELTVARGVDQNVKIPVIDILNDNNPHWIGAFVATGIYGSLDKLEIRYTCKPDTECSISLVD